MRVLRRENEEEEDEWWWWLKKKRKRETRREAKRCADGHPWNVEPTLHSLLLFILLPHNSPHLIATVIEHPRQYFHLYFEDFGPFQDREERESRCGKFREEQSRVCLLARLGKDRR